MSQYLMLVYESEASFATADEATLNEIMGGHNEFWNKHQSAIAGGNALEPTTTATVVRPSGNDFTVTDGPFAETKEALGGYYLVEAADLDEAIAIAKDIPAKFGCIEIRPIRVFG
ncbi:MAG TPA: YciI family protein [Mycobacteriales bacterium]|nr:YciI family protein [Mycobacteriales bacterium]